LGVGIGYIMLPTMVRISKYMRLTP